MIELQIRKIVFLIEILSPISIGKPTHEYFLHFQIIVRRIKRHRKQLVNCITVFMINWIALLFDVDKKRIVIVFKGYVFAYLTLC